MKLTVIILVILCVLIPFVPKPAELYDRTDYGTLTAVEQGDFRDILTAVEAEETVVYCEEEPDTHKLATHLGLYYGDLNNVYDLFTIINNDLHLNLSEFQKLQLIQSEVDEQVNQILPKIREGSDRFKLWQIAKYIARNYDYADDFTCANYTILFYKLASRFGIETYICTGIGLDEYHAWNMVVLDGEKYYYDVTWFDSSRNRDYLHSSDSWGRQFAVNNLWEGYYQFKME